MASILEGKNKAVESSLVSSIVDNLVIKENTDLVKNITEVCLRDVPNKKTSIEQAHEWMNWAKKHQHIKVVTSDIPDGILTKNQKGILYDVRIFSKRRVPDDELYDNNSDLRKKLARGNCFIEILNGEDAGLTCLVYAMKKFTGGFGDDDDRVAGNNQTWKKYFSKPIEESKIVVATRKANGEAAHFSARKISGEIYLSAGSKNVHLLIKNKKDIDKYTEDRFNYAKEIAYEIMYLLENMEVDTRKRLLKFMCETKLTAILEMESPKHQHVEDFSHLKKTVLKFITWTSSDLDKKFENACCMPPHAAIDIAQSLGFTAISYSLITLDKLDERICEIREGYGYEGEVLYFLDSNDTVIGLLKKKTIWYILCRATREKLRSSITSYQKSSGNFSLSMCLDKLEKRFDAIQKWLNLNDETVNEWKHLSTHCMRWCIHKVKSDELSMENIADLFPLTWKQFLAETQQTDKIEARSYDNADGKGLLFSD